MRIASLLIVCTALAGGLVGCVDDDGPSLFISANILPDSECIIGPDGTVLLGGTLNVEFNSGSYRFHPVYNNSLIQNPSEAPPRPDPNGILVDGAEVEVLDSAGDTVGFGGLPNPFTVRNTAFVPSSSGPTAPGTAVGSLDILPAAYVQALNDSFLPADPNARTQVLINVQPFGETLGHRSVDGRSYVWPVTLCRGRNCLYSPVTADEETSCCFPGQDATCPDSILPVAAP